MASTGDDICDFELIRRMADQNIDFAGARNAWGRLYVRHHTSLLDICTYEYGYMLGTEEARDLVNDAFLRAFDGAASFDHAEACDAIVQERKTRKWLARIAENLVRDRHRGQPEVRLVDDEDLERLSGATDNSSSQIHVPESKRLKLLKSGFSMLSDTEQTVLRATMFWWQADQKHQRMPHTAMEQLSRQVGKSPANIRQIRLRAVRELENYVNENLHNEKTD